MKKILYNIILMMFMIFPLSVFAEGYVSVTPSSITVEQGSSKTFTITAYNTIGDVSISSSNSNVASVNVGYWETGMVEEKQTKSGSVTIVGNNIGTATITLTIDAATFDGDDLAGQIKTLTVNVIAKLTPTPTPKPTPAQTPNSTTPSSNLSKNNNVKSLEVDGYDLVKVDNNNYTLSVTNDVTSINVKATVEDSKAKLTGVGVKELAVGENIIEVVITSESGLQNKITIKVIRKDGYYLEDLDTLLKNDNLKESDIIITSDASLSKEDISKIRDSKKTLRFNYFDENRKLLYSWYVNGSEINTDVEFLTLIEFTADNIDNIYKNSNYADGLYVKFKHEGDLPNGTKVKLYVGDKFSNESIVNLYYYNKTNKNLELVKNNLIVNDGYIEFDLNHCSDYFVTMSTIEKIQNNEVSSFEFLKVFAIVTTLIIIVLIVYIFIKVKPFKNKSNSDVKDKSLDLINSQISQEKNITNAENNVINDIIDQDNNIF